MTGPEDEELNEVKEARVSEWKPDVVAGWLWDQEAEEFHNGWVSWDEEGLVTEVGRGMPPGSLSVTAWGVILPTLINYHTHLGDMAFRKRLGKQEEALDVASIVGPGGLKHRWLQEAKAEQLVDGMAQGLQELAHNGCDGFVDFREGGLQGVELFKEAYSGVDCTSRPGTPFILGRPSNTEAPAKEVEALLDQCDGLGLSALRDLPPDTVQTWSKMVHHAGKVLALHASEVEREAMDDILDLEPHLLVHLCAATEKDLELVAQEGVEVVVTLGSNLRFGLTPAPVPRMVELGIPVRLGSDNAMLEPMCLMKELRLAHRLWPEMGVSGLMELLLRTAPKWLNKAPGYPPLVGEPAGLSVWNGSGSKPLDKLLAPDGLCRLRVAHRGGNNQCGSSRL